MIRDLCFVKRSTASKSPQLIHKIIFRTYLIGPFIVIGSKKEAKHMKGYVTYIENDTLTKQGSLQNRRTGSRDLSLAWVSRYSIARVEWIPYAKTVLQQQAMVRDRASFRFATVVLVVAV
jgi:hypothetical protein